MHGGMSDLRGTAVPASYSLCALLDEISALQPMTLFVSIS
jgi:hypothetical protein